MPTCVPPSFPARHRTRGVVLIITLIALVVLLVSGIALVKSFDTSLLVSGHLGFKRDASNQGERGVAKAMALLSAGALADEALRAADQGASNYSASMLPSDGRGIPLALVGDAQFAAARLSAPDLADAAAGVTIRYVIDRQCAAAGPYDEANCLSSQSVKDKGGSSWVKRAGGSARPLYRITVKVTGPRRTETYLQTLAAL